MTLNARNASLAAILLLCPAGILAQEAKKPEPTPSKPPELTEVSGRLMLEKDIPTTGGVAYFVFQKRIVEIPLENSMAKIHDLAEAAVEIDQEGSFTLEMAPGNYLLVYDPFTQPTAENLKPGAESMAVARKVTKEQIMARVDVIKENVQKGLAVADNAVPGGFVIENRFIRPPVTSFGEMTLGATRKVVLTLKGKDGQIVDFPANIKLRGKNGDIYEAHPPSVSDPGKYVFYDVFPQRVEVFGLETMPEPGSEEKPYIPVIEDAAFIFNGETMEKDIVVTKKDAAAAKAEREKAPPKPKN